MPSELDRLRCFVTVRLVRRWMTLSLVAMLLPHAPAAPEAAPSATKSSETAPTSEPLFEDIVITLVAEDGTPLEAKLSLPATRNRPVPVVFHLHGAGPRNYDHAIRYLDTAGQRQTVRYYDFYATELARRGVAFFRMSKRGCRSEPSGRPIVDRAIFSKTTPTILLADYAVALGALRQRKEIDARRIVLSGSSEGTMLAPRLALASPNGIVGLVLQSYAEDNLRNIVIWQNTIGPWRNVQKLVPAARDGALTKEEYAAAVKLDPALATKMPFATIDADANGLVDADEMARVVRPRLDAILKAVEERNDDLLWNAVVNLSSAYFQEGWDGEATSANLLKLKLPVGIFHGDLDGTTRVEGVREAETAFRVAGKNHLTVRIYPDYDHDLNWTPQSVKSGVPAPFQDAFAFAVGLVQATGGGSNTK